MGKLIARWQGSPPGRLMAKMGEDNAFNWAVIIAWNGLFSIFPIALVMAAAAGLIFGLIGVNSQGLYTAIGSMFPNDYQAQQEVVQALRGFRFQSGIFFVVGFAGLIWSGATLFGAMEQAFAVIYHTRQRPFVQQKLIALGMVLLLVILGGLTVLTSTVLGLIDRLPGLPGVMHFGPVAFLFQLVTGTIAGFVLFFAFYWFVPNRKQEFAKVWPGALLAGVMFELLTLLFPLYARVAHVGAAYGKVFGLMFVLLTFMYFLGLLTMVGVETNALLYPIPVEQPDDDPSLQSPIQGGGARSAGPGRAYDAGVGRRPALPAHKRPSLVKAAIGMAVVGAGSLLGRRRRVT